MKRIFILILLFLFNTDFKVYSQEILGINPSPSFDFVGGAYTALPTSDPFAFYFNPAQLGNYGLMNNLSYDINDNLFTGGYDFNTFIPISIGLSYFNDNLSYLSGYDGINYFKVDESYMALSIGVGIRYYLHFNMGYTIKDFKSSILSIRDQGEIPINKKYHATDITDDFGLQLIIPVVDIWNSIFNKKFSLPKTYFSMFDVSFGYAVLNSSGKLVYEDPEQPTFFPKTAKIGYAITVGLQKDFYNQNYCVYKLSWTSEANEQLTDYNKLSYISAPGNISFWNNVILANSKENVYTRQGWQIKIFDTFKFGKGTLSYEFYDDVDNYGFMINSFGLFKLLSSQVDSNIIDFISEHIKIYYAHSNIKMYNFEKKYDSITFTIFGF